MWRAFFFLILIYATVAKTSQQGEEKRKKKKKSQCIPCGSIAHTASWSTHYTLWRCARWKKEKKKKTTPRGKDEPQAHSHGKKNAGFVHISFSFFLVCVCVSWAAVRVSGIPLLRRHLWQRVRPLGSVSASHRAAKMTEARGREITCGGFNARVNPLGLTRGTRATLDASILHDDSTFFYCFQGPTDCLMLFTASHSERLAERPPPLSSN